MKGIWKWRGYLGMGGGGGGGEGEEEEEGEGGEGGEEEEEETAGGAGGHGAGGGYRERGRIVRRDGESVAPILGDYNPPTFLFYYYLFLSLVD